MEKTNIRQKISKFVYGIIVVAIAGFVLISIYDSGSSQSNYAQDYDFEEPSYCQEKIAELESDLEEYQAALQQANENIENANDMISSARSYSEESYEEMVNALDSLSEIETVPEPY